MMQPGEKKKHRRKKPDNPPLRVGDVMNRGSEPSGIRG